MGVADLLWAVLAAVGGAIWVLVLFIRDRKTARAELNSSLIKRIHEMDKTVIEHPEVQQYLSLNAGREEQYFRTAEVLNDVAFYKAKSFAYWHLNLFDEIICNASESQAGPTVLSPQVAELADWETYIKHKIGHPLYRSILNNESQIFGLALRDFWVKNKGEVDAIGIDPYSW